MRAVVLIPGALADVCIAGRTLDEHFADIVLRAGHELARGDGPALYIDGRFASVQPASLSRLSQPGDAVCTPSGAIIAAVVSGPDGLANATGEPVQDAEAHDLTRPGGVSRTEREVRLRIALALEASGVLITDPARITIDATVRVEPGARLWGEVVLIGDTVVERGSEIRPGCWVEDTYICEGALIKPHSVCIGAHVGPDSQVGPMAHLRPGAVLKHTVKIGNFVEVKKTTLHQGAKASHLTYLGDAEIGEHANIGAGTITCNYDGHRKHRTTIGAGAFIGSNSSLVAPVNVGAGAIVGAGSVLTRDTPDDALAVERGALRILEGKALRLNKRNAELARRQREQKSEG